MNRTIGSPRSGTKRVRMVYFVVHDENDSVGVVAVEGVKSGDSLAGWIMDQNKAITVKAARRTT